MADHALRLFEKGEIIGLYLPQLVQALAGIPAVKRGQYVDHTLTLVPQDSGGLYWVQLLLTLQAISEENPEADVASIVANLSRITIPKKEFPVAIMLHILSGMNQQDQNALCSTLVTNDRQVNCGASCWIFTLIPAYYLSAFVKDLRKSIDQSLFRGTTDEYFFKCIQENESFRNLILTHWHTLLSASTDRHARSVASFILSNLEILPFNYHHPVAEAAAHKLEQAASTDH